MIETDVRWRVKAITREAASPAGPAGAGGRLLSLDAARVLISDLERQRITMSGAQEGLQRLRDVAIRARAEAQSAAKNRRLSERFRAEQDEVAEWLGVWIKTPNLFADWLDLRRRSSEYRERFPEYAA